MTGEGRPPDGTGSGHRLEPLFNPGSVAVIGASGREGRPGNQAIRGLGAIGYRGRLYPVTPSYQEIESHRCYPDIASVPERVDLAVIAGATERIEAQLRAAIEARARAALVFANGLLKDDVEPPILERIAAMAREAAIPLLGPNSIGYVNWEAHTAATWVPPTGGQPGPIAAVIQSGSNYGYAYILDPRLEFALAVHPGQEATLTTADVMDYALELGSTRVLALYL
ncbi:MAG: CoA-binding protein, partial [Alphaproteobacteria bacterium]